MLPAAEEAEALKAKEDEHWQRAKEMGEEARKAGRAEVERRLNQVRGHEGRGGCNRKPC
jgi:hypothetical protein